MGIMPQNKQITTTTKAGLCEPELRILSCKVTVRLAHRPWCLGAAGDMAVLPPSPAGRD